MLQAVTRQALFHYRGSKILFHFRCFTLFGQKAENNLSAYLQMVVK